MLKQPNTNTRLLFYEQTVRIINYVKGRKCLTKQTKGEFQAIFENHKATGKRFSISHELENYPAALIVTPKDLRSWI